MSSADKEIQDACQEAAARIIAQTSSLRAQLTCLQQRNEALDQRATGLTNELEIEKTKNTAMEKLKATLQEQGSIISKQSCDLLEAQSCAQRLESQNESLKQEIARLKTGTVNSIHDSPAPSHAVIPQTELTSHVAHDPAATDDAKRLARKYKKLKDTFESMQARYRRERNVWKQWIEVFEGLDPEVLKSHALKGTTTSPLTERSPNVMPGRVTEASASPTKIKTEVFDKQDIAMPQKPAVAVADEQVESDADDRNMPSSALDTQSIDLDQLTRRRLEPTPLPRLAEHATTELPKTTPRVLFAEQSLPHKTEAALHQSAFVPTSSPEDNAEDDAQIKAEIQSLSCESTPRKLKRSQSEAQLDGSGLLSEQRRPRSSRGLGRYKTGLPTTRPELTTPTAQVSSDRMAKKYAANEVVRGSARQGLHASDCPCCSAFYRLAGPAVESRAPVWDTPTVVRSTPSNVTTSRQQVGRHRSVWRRSPTPPEFWNCDFPTTQELLDERRANDRRRSRLTGQTAREMDNLQTYLKQE